MGSASRDSINSGSCSSHYSTVCVRSPVGWILGYGNSRRGWPTKELQHPQNLVSAGFPGTNSHGYQGTIVFYFLTNFIHFAMIYWRGNHDLYTFLSVCFISIQKWRWYTLVSWMQCILHDDINYNILYSMHFLYFLWEFCALIFWSRCFMFKSSSNVWQALDVQIYSSVWHLKAC